MIETKKVVKAAEASDLRLRLVGKTLVGFDTKRWSTADRATPIEARIGNKPGQAGAKPGTQPPIEQ